MNMSASSTANEENSTNLEASPGAHQMPPSSSFIANPIGTTTGNTQPGGSINSIMNFIYPNYQPSHIGHSINTGAASAPQSSMNLGLVEDTNTNSSSSSSSMSVAAAISGASATLAQSQDEPKMKKVKLNHFNFFKNQLFADGYKQQGNMMHGSGSNTSSQDLQAFYMNHKKLEDRIGGILCCTVCLDLPSTAIYQCTNGHLMCAGCFSHLLADARLKDEQSTCPNCRCEISKSSCSRNLAVEKTLSELPANCQFCNVMVPRNCLEQHQRNECMERPVKCSYERIGCTWEGPFHELNDHDESCSHPNRPCKEIMEFLKKKDRAYEEEEQVLSTMVNMLSYEKICFNDLQFKQYRTDEITPKLYFETNRFSAFFHQWVLKARVNDNQKNPNLSLNRHISFQLILKSRMSSSQSSLEIKFCILKGPFGEVFISPRVQTFEFSQNKLETDWIKLDINPEECNKLLSSKIINFRHIHNIMSQKLTSLSAQLKRLQVPQTNLLNIAGDKRRVSFLYDPKEAANMDSEAVFSVAMNGLEQLKLIDQETFESFELTLFNSSSISFERAIQTKQVNEKLDQELRRFLIHLSPYFMLKSAHKCFEWLVFRYQIHTYNLNELFMCVLPYHETNYFVRALQLINFQSTTLSKEHKLWEWLHENQKHGVQLASSTLATHVFSDLSFLNFFIGYLRESIEELSSTSELIGGGGETQQKRWLNTLNFIFGFVTKTLLQSIKQLSLQTKLKSKQQETFLAQLLPVLFEGFKSDLIVYKQSAYLVCSFLFEKFKFNTETSNKTLFALSKGLSTFRSNQMDSDETMGDEETTSTLKDDKESLDCMQSAILAICLIVQSQQNLKSNELLMSKNFLKKLVKNFHTQIDILIDTVDSLNESYKIENFLHCLFNRLIVDLVAGDQTNQEAFNSISLDLDSFKNDETELENKAKNEYSQLLLKLINKLDLNKNQSLIEYLITRLFESLVNQVRDENNNTLKCLRNTEDQQLPNYLVEYHLCELIYRCENKYPNQFDQCLNLFLESKATTQEQKNYLLTTISSRFATFKCRTTFKYQQVKSGLSTSEQQTEFNLVLSLNSPNASVRANGLDFILKKLESNKTDSLIDETFVREQLEIKFSGESSPHVLESLLKFDLKLINYFSLSELLENENYLLKLFKHDVIQSSDIDLNDKSQEMLDFLAAQNKNYLSARTQALDLIFTGLYKKSTIESKDTVDTKSQFFNCFIAIMTRLFELRSIELLTRLKESKFYAEINENNDTTNAKNPPAKKFYSSSSISLTNMSTGVSKTSRLVTDLSDKETDNTLNELFDQYMQICVKHLLASHKQSTDMLIKHPKCFDTLELESCSLLNIIIFEVSVRLCTQSLFLTNASFYLSLCTRVLASFFESKTGARRTGKFQVFAEHFAKTETNTEVVTSGDSKCNSFCSYQEMIGAKKRQLALSPQLLVDLYTCLFKSINIQTSNFVNENSKLEIEAILNQLYTHLCLVCAESEQSFVLILKKFAQSSFFNSMASPSATSSSKKPTKISSCNNSNISNSFLQFAFKFLIYSGDEDNLLLNENSNASDSLERAQLLLSTAQERTIQLFNIYLKDLVAFGKNSNESSMLNALVLVLSWCLTSKASNIRTEALDLLNKCHQFISEHIYTQANEHDDSKWLNYIKKLLKHREEIQVDGGSYVRSKCLNKIFSSSTEFFAIIEQFLSATTASTCKTFFSNYMNANHSLAVLNKFKFCLLDLFKELKADVKLPFMDVTMNLFLNICNDDLANGQELSGIFEKMVQTLATNYFITSKSSQYFAKNEKYFDYLIGYLNRAFQRDSKNPVELKAAQIISKFSESLINRLSDLSSGQVKDFFKNLTVSMQNELVECLFDIWLSSPAISSSVIKSCLLAFNLSASHLLNIFHSKIHLTIVKSKEDKASTTKEMKKQLKNFNMNSIVQIDWKCLKYLLDFLQHYFSFNENKMDTEETVNSETFMDLIPYLFLSLETIETTLACKKDSQLELELVPVNKAQQVYLNNEDNLMQYLEIMALSCLLAIYKLNIENNKSALAPQQFNIELLMQILHTKHSDEEELRCNQATIDNLNVQEYVLLLLSEIATVFPDKVLEHVLIMFVFVGTKLARKDDSYSFQIIKKIIQTILPSIVNSINNSNEHVTELAKYNDSNKKVEVVTAAASQDRLKKTVNTVQRHQKQLPYVSSLVCKILQSFVVALPHIPAHRKTIIFSQLLEIIGLDNYLWITIIQSIDHYLVQSIDLLDFTKSLAELASKQQSIEGKSEKHLRDTLKTTCLQSMISLHVQFEPIVVIKTSIYLVCFLNKYISSLFDTAYKLLTTTNTNRMNSATLANLNLPSNKIQNKAVYSHLACQLDNYNILQMKYLAYNVLAFISDLIINEDFLVKLATEQQSNNSAADESANNSQFQELLEKILLLILKLSQIFNVFEQFAANKTNKSTTSLAMINDLRKFHKAIVNKAYDLMERSISLLDSKQFIRAIKLLIKHDLMQIRRRVLGLLNTKLRKYEPSEEETTLLITMLDDLLASMKLSNLSNDSMVTDVVESPADQIDIEINNQTILFSIKLLCKRIGETQPLAFVKVIRFISDNMIVRGLYLPETGELLNIQNINLLSSVLLCVGELCLKLKSTALVYLNRIMTFTLEIVDVIRKKTGHFEEGDSDKDLDVEYLKEDGSATKPGSVNKNYELLILSCVTCLLKIVQNMASFISPFLPRMMYATCSLSRLISTATSNSNKNNSLTYPQIEIRLAQLRSSMATLIPLRLLGPILNDQASLAEHFSSKKSVPYKITANNIEYYMSMVTMTIRHVNQEDLLQNIRLIRSMFMNLFDFRTLIVARFEADVNNRKAKNQLQTNQFYDNVNKYEDHIIDAFSELIFKLSEDLFKPIFFKLYEWATANEPPKDRLVTFYRTTLKLSGKLKNLFVLFASQFLSNASTTMELLNLSKTKSAFFGEKYSQKDELLLYSIIDTLSNVFKNDSQKSFANKDCFKLLIQPLVDQLDNEINEDSYGAYVAKHLAPCIANLASSCVQDDALCRKFNYQILLKTKSSSVHVRMAALDVLNLFSKKIGDIYNSYLSETVPFLAELMEDPIEEVEEKVQELIKELEEMLGESLQDHFV